MIRRKKEIRQVFELIKNSDLILEVLDSRIPNLTRVSSIEKEAKKQNIPLILVLNKCDLIPYQISEKTKKKYNREFPTYYISSRERQGTKIFRNAIPRYLKKKKENILSIVGVPNTGKSSLLNILRGKHVAVTGQKPGVTRSPQLIRISQRILIYDTPGVIPFDYPEDDLQVFLGAYSIDNLDDPIGTVNFFIDRIRENYSSGFVNYYGITSINLSNEEILKQIAALRGMKSKGGLLNLLETAKLVMREFTAGKIQYWEEV
ncbi:GTPase [Candidatus Hodarchaeum mangrovi]